MCTAIFDNKYGNLFGRTLDLECSFGEEVVICPRDYPLPLRHLGEKARKYSILGTAYVKDGTPLYYDGVNEAGLCAAGLNFPVTAKYYDRTLGKVNLAPFELIPYILGNCDSLDKVKNTLARTAITSESFSDDLPATPLHWMFADKSGAIAVECSAEGLKVYDDPVGVLTNEPSFDFQLLRLADYSALGPRPSKNNLTDTYRPTLYSRGLGAYGLPGDFSSASRFVRAVFAKNHTTSEKGEKIGRLFHIMNTVAVPRGCVITDEGCEVETVYTSCIDLDTLTYHYTTYSSPTIRSLTLTKEYTAPPRLIRRKMCEEDEENGRDGGSERNEGGGTKGTKNEEGAF